MSRVEDMFLLYQRGKTLADIGAVYGISRQAVSLILKGYGPYNALRSTLKPNQHPAKPKKIVSKHKVEKPKRQRKAKNTQAEQKNYGFTSTLKYEWTGQPINWPEGIKWTPSR